MKRRSGIAPALLTVHRTPNYNSPRFIAVEGPIRVGKSSLAKILADRLQGVYLEDTESNPFLEGFYKDLDLLVPPYQRSQATVGFNVHARAAR